jgi:hypothetical protein
VSLRDLIDIRIVAPEGLLKSSLPIDNPEKMVKKPAGSTQINDNDRTYFNPELNKYLLDKTKVQIITKTGM